ncbi:MAG TPA: DUF952 domain-containing protein [Candidatus Limnocylindrales bacterium]|nr:DUF952 domain-containing protein [Candidatus Limnocylindrales bacterium]
MRYILHIIPHAVWEQAQLSPGYRGDTLDAEGFIHFSTPAQVVGVANARFRGHTGLLLLVVDPDRLQSEVRYESPFESTSPHEANQQFPHLYGPLNLDAVIRAVSFEPGADGLFSLPDGVL